MSFIVYWVPRRRLKTVVAIPWAEPFVPPVVGSPYPSFLSPPFFRIDRVVTLLRVPELNVYPETPPNPANFLPAWFHTRENKTDFKQNNLGNLPLDTYPETPPDSSTFYTAWLLKESIQSEFTIENQTIPEHNVYPIGASKFYPAWLRKDSHRITFDRKHLRALVLDEYPETDPFFTSGFYPGSRLASSFITKNTVKHQVVQPFDDWPFVPPPPSTARVQTDLQIRISIGL